jgi:hypothetical protein
VIPFPAPFDVAGRAAELQKILDDDAVASDQKVNIRVVIEMYEDGDPPKRIDEWIFVQDGVVCERLPDFSKGTPWWGEVIMTTRKCTLTMYVLLTMRKGGTALQMRVSTVDLRQIFPGQNLRNQEPRLLLSRAGKEVELAELQGGTTANCATSTL